jgi:hypothetical protein
MLVNAVGVEFSPTALPALDEFGGVVLSDFHPVLTVNLLDAALFESVALPLLRWLSVLLLSLGRRRWWLLFLSWLGVGVAFGLVDGLVFLVAAFGFVVVGVLLHLVIDILVGV